MPYSRARPASDDSHPIEYLEKARWRQYHKIICLYFGALCVALLVLFVVLTPKQGQEPAHATSTFSSLDQRWGFDEHPTRKCQRQERTATILALLLGAFGVDQFYAHHWVLGVFKLLTGGGLLLWAFVDTILWIVGGVYGTPGCPGGSPEGWRY